jgi:hypothetical protein
LPALHTPIRSVPLSHQTVHNLHLPSVSLSNNSVTRHSVCNVRSCAATISLPVSPFRSPPDSHRNVSSPPISCLSIILISRPCITWLSQSF